jgi:hypothetical protein
MRSFVRAGVVVVGLVIGLGARAAADPVLVVGGNFTVNPLFTFANFSVTLANGSTVSGSWPVDSATTFGALACGSCAPGTLVSPVASFVEGIPFVFQDPFATVNGRVASGELHFSGASFVLPPPEVPPFETRLLSFLQPFAFSGTVTGYEKVVEGPRDPVPLFTIDFAGTGSARMNFLAHGTDAGPVYEYFSTSYDFAPVPEPLSVLTVTGGLLAVWRRRRTLLQSRM